MLPCSRAVRVPKRREVSDWYGRAREYRRRRSSFPDPVPILKCDAEQFRECSLWRDCDPRSSSPRRSRVSPGWIPKIPRACFGITICPFSPTVAVHAYFPSGPFITCPPKCDLFSKQYFMALDMSTVTGETAGAVQVFRHYVHHSWRTKTAGTRGSACRVNTIQFIPYEKKYYSHSTGLN